VGRIPPDGNPTVTTIPPGQDETQHECSCESKDGFIELGMDDNLAEILQGFSQQLLVHIFHFETQCN